MKKIYSAALAACMQLSAVSTYAQEYKLDEDVVIVVTKRPKLASMVGSAFSRIDSEEIQRSQSVSLTQALSTIPGMMAVDAGGRGSFAQFSIRGNTAAQTLYLLDGIRVNTLSSPNAMTFLNHTSTSGLGSIEVARGPQSSLYGSDGIGGVVSMESERGKGKPSIALTSEIGSFSSFRERVASQGEIDKLAYSLSYEREDTANNRPHNDFGSNRYAMRLDTDLNQDLSLRLNFRGHASEYQSPRYLGLEKVESNLVSLITNWKVNDVWTQKLTLGSYFDRYHYIPGSGPSGPEESANYSADWMHSIQLSENNIGTAGIEFNYQTTQTAAPLYKERSNWAAYIQDEWEVFQNFNITSGARYDSYSLAGDAWTYRFTGAYLFTKTDTKIRSSYGTAFKAPNFRELHSTDPWGLGNPDLKPETSQGWDIGFDQYLLSRKMVFSGTYFRNDITNLIAVETDPNWNGTYVNRDKAKNNGIELELKATLMEDWMTRLAYTYTESTETKPSGTKRRGGIPRQQIGLDTNYCLFKKWTIGCGATIAIDREDRFGFEATDIEDYFTARVYSRYEHNDHLAIFGRVENVTNTDYEYFAKEPALPIGFYGGVELKF